ncbi:ankyrin repeat domain-containing protein [Mycolicibacterium canariasense]|uniref:ankyrin repeat domain-containing protein n=1 Tax=Mycolicibacterium canariasense TaxID=228230 RepID=UPI0013F4D5C7|nr:ankyrin repeat domain-containing protein [Mycolicibacterium canariasense]MCV7211171.1 ankyrin repeat domain-containing protein [Mycolicibacterium canariasense]
MARTPLHASAAYNFVDDLRREIAEGYDINGADETGFTPLHSACFQSSYDTAKVLLEAGASTSLQDKWGNTPLNYVVKNNENSLRMVTLLLEYGADPTIENNYGHSPLRNSKRMQGTEQLIPLLESATRKNT